MNMKIGLSTVTILLFCPGRGVNALGVARLGWEESGDEVASFFKRGVLFGPAALPCPCTALKWRRGACQWVVKGKGAGTGNAEH